MSFDDGENVGGTSQESKPAGNSDDPQAWLTMCREILSAATPPEPGLCGFVADKLIKLAAGVEPLDGPNRAHCAKSIRSMWSTRPPRQTC
jgi:hypothetical protein